MTTLMNERAAIAWDRLKEIFLEPRQAFRGPIFDAPASHAVAWGLAAAWLGTAVQTLSVVAMGETTSWVSDPFWNWFLTGLSLCVFPFCVAGGLWLESVGLSWSSRVFSGSERTLATADALRIEGTALVPLLFTMIPGFGGFIAAVWRLGLLILGVEVRLQVSRSRAIWIVFAPVVAIVTLVFGMVLFAGILWALLGF